MENICCPTKIFDSISSEEEKTNVKSTIVLQWFTILYFILIMIAFLLLFGLLIRNIRRQRSHTKVMFSVMSFCQSVYPERGYSYNHILNCCSLGESLDPKCDPLWMFNFVYFVSPELFNFAHDVELISLNKRKVGLRVKGLLVFYLLSLLFLKQPWKQYGQFFYLCTFYLHALTSKWLIISLKPL